MHGDRSARCRRATCCDPTITALNEPRDSEAAPCNDLAVVARGLRKSYGSFEAVKGIDFEIRRGECFGFLGPNGAGKSTTMRMIYRASDVGGGSLHILGYDASTPANDRAIKAGVGVVHQEDNLDQDLTVAQTIEVFCRFYGLYGAAAADKVDELLAFAELSHRRDNLISALSGGMKRRLMVARGLIGTPRLVVLDEPTTGLDPRARQALWEKLAALKRREATLILTTHYMEEAERLCDRLVIMDLGEIVAEGRPKALILEHAAPHVVEVDLDGEGEPPEAETLRSRASASDVLGGHLLLYTDDGDALLAETVTALPGHDIHLRRATLDDVFLRLTGRGLDGDA